MKYKFSTEICKALAEMQAAIKLEVLPAVQKRQFIDGLWQMIDVEPMKYRAILVDGTTKQVLGTEVGEDYDQAVKALMAKAATFEKAKTPAELALENARLKAQLAAALNKSEPEPAEEPLEEDTLPPPGGNYEEMTGAELYQALLSNQITPPEGDRRSKEWKAAAIRALTAPATK